MLRAAEEEASSRGATVYPARCIRPIGGGRATHSSHFVVFMWSEHPVVEHLQLHTPEEQEGPCTDSHRRSCGLKRLLGHSGSRFGLAEAAPRSQGGIDRALDSAQQAEPRSVGGSDRAVVRAGS